MALTEAKLMSRGNIVCS